MERYHAARVAAGGVLLIGGALLGFGGAGCLIGAALPAGPAQMAGGGLLLAAALLTLWGRSWAHSTEERD